MAEIELSASEVGRIEAIQVAALVGTAEEIQIVRRIMARASKRRSRKSFEIDLATAETVLGIAS